MTIHTNLSQIRLQLLTISEKIDEIVKDMASGAEQVDTGNSTSYVNVKQYIPRHNSKL